jgi:hypothetical protein
MFIARKVCSAIASFHAMTGSAFTLFATPFSTAKEQQQFQQSNVSCWNGIQPVHKNTFDTDFDSEGLHTFFGRWALVLAATCKVNRIKRSEAAFGCDADRADASETKGAKRQ